MRFLPLLVLLLPGCQTPEAAPDPKPVHVPVTPGPAPVIPLAPKPTPVAESPAPVPLEAPPTASVFVAPALEQGKGRTAKYVDAPKYDANNVADMVPGASSPEAAVVHYLASRIRGDEHYREVMLARCSRGCGLAYHDRWKFRAFRLVSRTQVATGKFEVKAWFEVKAQGSVESGEDEFTVVAEGDEFRIAEVPS
ncbi:MAG TPA: hypothetical protein VGB85_27670 [Nannocystis sp.]